MTCTNCKSGRMVEGKTILTFSRDNSTIVVKDVDALVCDLCGAWYLIPEVVEEVRQIVDTESKSGHEVSVIKMGKAA